MRLRTLLTTTLTLATLSTGAHAQSTFLIADDGFDKIIRFRSSNGVPIDGFVCPGLSPLNGARGMTIGPDGLLYVASHDAHEVLRYNASTGEYLGVFVTQSLGGLSWPTDLTFGPDGYLYVASTNANSVRRFGAVTGLPIDDGDNGNFVTPNDGGLNDPLGLAFHPNGDLYVASGNTDEVIRFDGTTGNYIDAIVPAQSGGLDGPRDILISADGSKLYVSSYETDSVNVYNTANGAFLGFAAPPGTGLDGPIGLSFGTDGLLHVVSNRNDRVLGYNVNVLPGQFVDIVVGPNAGGINDPWFIYFLPDVQTCTADIDVDGSVGTSDLLLLLANWGECP